MRPQVKLAVTVHNDPEIGASLYARLLFVCVLRDLSLGRH